MTETIKVDGNYLEGGGQIVRTALALSTLLGKPFEICDIRKGRKVPGLKAQHLAAINVLKELCNAKTNPVQVGSEFLSYEPGELVPRTIGIDIGTAGSITLLLQSLWLPLVFHGGKFRLKIKGGTDVSWSMQMDYLKEVFVPQIKRYADVELELLKRGYYPEGGGEIELRIKGYSSFSELIEKKKELPKINLVKQGHLMQIKGISHASTELEEAQVAERQARAAKHKLSVLGAPVQISMQYYKTLCAGSGITLWAIFSDQEDDIDIKNPIRLGADVLGERGKRAEVVGEETAEKLIKEIKSGAAVDSHLADNLVPLIGVVGGSFKASEITSHTKTNIYAVEKFLGKCIEVDEKEGVVRS
jgi:RNA 3'-terminal phosphate cyclase (GTP)